MESQRHRSVCFLSTVKACTSSLLENALYEREASLNGWSCTRNPAEADVVVLNTCGYSKEAEDRTLNNLRTLRLEYPDKQLVVGGCLARINPEAVAAQHKGETFAPGDVIKLLSLLELRVEHLPLTGAVLGPKKLIENPPKVPGLLFREGDVRKLPWPHKLFFVARKLFFRMEEALHGQYQPLHNIFLSATVNSSFYAIAAGKGCLGACTYCVIKKARGSLTSTPLDQIMAAIRDGLRQGHSNYWLNADDLGCWGLDFGSNISILLQEILSLENHFNLVLGYVSPEWFIRYFHELEPLLKDRRVVACYIPLHSGSDRVLERMGRKYHARELLEKVRAVKREHPAMAIKTNYITAFPGETFRDFLKSCLSLWAFDVVVFNVFSPRPGAKATLLPGRKGWGSRTIGRSIFVILVFIRHLHVAIVSLTRGSSQ